MPITRLPATELLPRLTQFSHIIDARSEDEYALDHLPGAVNWPTLRNEERRIVGTAFKQISAFEARKRGAAMAARTSRPISSARCSRCRRTGGRCCTAGAAASAAVRSR